MISNRTLDPLISPVTNSELAEFLSVEASDPLLPGLLLAASQACIDYTNIELLERDYTLKYDRTPERQAGYAGLGIMGSLSAWWISIPLWPVPSIQSVTVGGEVVTPDQDLNSKPARVAIQGFGPTEVHYTAGHADSADIPPLLILGIKMLAAYLYEHRGACDVQDAIKQSGAASVWASSRMILSL